MDGPWKIVEGVAGMWHYHLAEKGGSAGTALCGRDTMPTGLALSTWGLRSQHIGETYCRRCEAIAGKGGSEMGIISSWDNKTYTEEVARIRATMPAERHAKDDIIVWQADQIAALKEQVEALGDGDSDHAALMRCEAEVERLERVIRKMQSEIDSYKVEAKRVIHRREGELDRFLGEGGLPPGPQPDGEGDH